MMSPEERSRRLRLALAECLAALGRINAVYPNNDTYRALAAGAIYACSVITDRGEPPTVEEVKAFLTGEGYGPAASAVVH
jgi:hypothetical protein